jgi:hypothetical protein
MKARHHCALYDCSYGQVDYSSFIYDCPGWPVCNSVQMHAQQMRNLVTGKMKPARMR